MKVICIDNQNLIEGGVQLLTVGKIYYVTEITNEVESSTGNNSMYYIVDNTGNIAPYRRSRFKMLRESNLEELGI